MSSDDEKLESEEKIPHDILDTMLSGIDNMSELEAKVVLYCNVIGSADEEHINSIANKLDIPEDEAEKYCNNGIMKMFGMISDEEGLSEEPYWRQFMHDKD